MTDETCRFAGCVGLADVGGLCPVHRLKLGTPCDYCKGAAVLVSATARRPCDRCGGTGLKDTRARRVTRVTGSDPVDARELIRESEE